MNNWFTIFLRLTCVTFIEVSLHICKNNMIIRHIYLLSSISPSYPRDATRVSAVFAIERWLARYLTRRYCVWTDKSILKLFRPSDSPVILVFFFYPERRHQIPRGTASEGALNTGDWRFSTEITVYLGNGTRWANGYYGTLIRSHRWRIDTCRFRRHWVTPNPGFKVTVYLQVKYLKNGASWRQSYYRTLIGNHRRSTEWYNFQWPWVTSDPDFKVTTFFDIEYLRNGTR